MSKVWKGVCVLALVAAVAALGISLADWMGIAYEEPTARGDKLVYVDLKQVMLRYDDPMRGMSGEITYRQVFEDALWWQINDPQTSVEERVQAFLMVGLMHEGRGTEIDEKQRDILMRAVKTVWGPGVVAAVEKELK